MRRPSGKHYFLARLAAFFSCGVMIAFFFVCLREFCDFAIICPEICPSDGEIEAELSPGKPRFPPGSPVQN